MGEVSRAAVAGERRGGRLMSGIEYGREARFNPADPAKEHP